MHGRKNTELINSYENMPTYRRNNNLYRSWNSTGRNGMDLVPIFNRKLGYFCLNSSFSGEYTLSGNKHNIYNKL